MSDYPPPRKRFGQHFLTDPRILTRIVDALAPSADETVIEIGPGRGALTDVLLQRAGRVIAIEIDRDLAPRLRARHAHDARLEVIEDDVLAVDFAAASGGPYLVAGNVPYNITTPILFHALRAPRPRRAVYLVQREVAERVVAPPGHDDYGALSVNVQAVAHAEMVFRVSAGSFNPPPKVESAVLRITPRVDPVIAEGAEAGYRALVQAAFGLRRKQMRRVVRTVLQRSAEEVESLLAVAGIPPEARPEVLSPDDFARLLRAASPIG
ncbi:MAG: ribosomal RNA small subunit methyltransferase A [Gemmatimonadaceae bacterium]|nr:ribosomal RNA small subunit methyltransferase A [Gemmatimonadaceae bacterium]